MWRCDTTRTRNAIIFKPTGEACGLDQPGIGGAIFLSSINAKVLETQERCQGQQAAGAVCPDQPIV